MLFWPNFKPFHHSLKLFSDLSLPVVEFTTGSSNSESISYNPAVEDFTYTSDSDSDLEKTIRVDSECNLSTNAFLCR
jgi:hypothetical protein